MKKFLIGMLIVGGVIGVIAVIVRRRSGSDEWDSFAEDTYAQASTSASKIADAAKDTASKVSDVGKKTVSKVAGATKD